MKHLPILVLIALTALAAAPWLSGQQSGTLRQVTFSRIEDKAVFLVKVEGEFTYETTVLTMPRRLVIDLTPVGRIAASPYLQVNASGVSAVRTGQFKSDTARVVFDLFDQNETHTVSASATGLIVSFSVENARPKAIEPEKTVPVRKIPQEEVRQAVEGPSAGSDRLNFFVRAGAGVNVFLKSKTTISQNFPLYGETGSISETYAQKIGLAFDASLGKFFRWGGSRIKAGLGFSYWKLPNEGTFTLSLPHPFLTDTPRTVTFSETSALKKSFMTIYAYALFPLIDGENISFFVGPLLGFSSGKFLTLGDWDITEQSPYSSADVTVTNKTYTENSVSQLIFGASASLEYKLGQSLALVLDTKLIYLNPTIASLANRVSLIHIQPTLGIQINF
jgi:hypothetical protein